LAEAETRFFQDQQKMMSHVLKNQEDKAKIRLLEDDDVNF
jgi:hypothetical protein